jgi:hypothetical protein
MKPAAYHYPDAHPDLEAFPKSSLPPTPAHQGQAPVSGKRKSPPPTLSPETTVVLKQTKAAPSGSRGRIRAADFEGISKAVLDDAIKEFSTLIATRHAFPEKLSSDDREKWAAECWVLACKKRSIQMEFDNDASTLVHHLITNFRSLINFLDHGTYL